MNTDVLFQIWDRFDSSDAAELLFETADGRVQLRRTVSIPEQGRNEKGSAGENAASLIQRRKNGPVRTKEAKESRAVRAPLVGTFYRAPAPGEKPFVRPGQQVKKGDTLGIIEAMKMMNEITAPCDGSVLSILVEDETLVEFDQCLMTIGEENV